MATITYGDGLRIELPDGETIVADANAPDGDVAVVSHAHGDHLYRTPPEAAVWSPLTRDLAAVRRGDASLPDRVDHPRIELLDAGHVPGSRAALIEDDVSGEEILYTGDVSTRDRLFLSGFEPPPADVLIVESTYGDPADEFPPTEGVERAVLDWLSDHADRPAVLLGYSLGRAQEIQYLLGRSNRDRVFVSSTIASLSDVVATHLDVDLPGTVFDQAETDLRAGDALVVSGRQRRHLTDLIERTGAVTAGFSGWAIDEGYRYARNLDAGFPLSDHCDFTELCALVESVDPETVYVLHGSKTAFATHLTRELGYEAIALERNQSRLSQF